jgi:hypothetical protein
MGAENRAYIYHHFISDPSRYFQRHRQKSARPMADFAASHMPKPPENQTRKKKRATVGDSLLSNPFRWRERAR